MKRGVLGLFALVVIIAVAVAGRYFYIESERFERERQAFEGLEEIQCEVYSQPAPFMRYCSYTVICSDKSRLTDSNVGILVSLNHMAAGDELHLIISASAVTDNSVEALTKLKKLDVLDVSRSAVSMAGLDKLQEGLPNVDVIR